jgi:hypothetical protein
MCSRWLWVVSALVLMFGPTIASAQTFSSFEEAVAGLPCTLPNGTQKSINVSISKTGAVSLNCGQPPRYVDNDDGTVTDVATGLVWLKNANCLGVLDYSTEALPWHLRSQGRVEARRLASTRRRGVSGCSARRSPDRVYSLLFGGAAAHLAHGRFRLQLLRRRISLVVRGRVAWLVFSYRLFSAPGNVLCTSYRSNGGRGLSHVSLQRCRFGVARAKCQALTKLDSGVRVT